MRFDSYPTLRWSEFSIGFRTGETFWLFYFDIPGLLALEIASNYGSESKHPWELSILYRWFPLSNMSSQWQQKYREHYRWVMRETDETES